MIRRLMNPTPARGRQWREIDRTLNIYRQAYSAGDHLALFQALSFALESGMPVPEWAANPLAARISKVLSKETACWNEAFGRPYPKGAQVRAQRRREQLAPQVHLLVTEERRKSGMALGESLFSDIGHQLGISRSLCSKLYYQERKFHQMIDAMRDILSRSAV
jgi:hypothetical protein